nr:GNAT family N-acetyltransferase [Paracoccus sp. C2R09]
MDRVPAPRTALLGRIRDRAAGAGFAACHDGVAMVHGIEVLPDFRRMGLGSWLVRTAAFWAAEQGADTIALAVSRSNEVARATYASLGFAVAGSYAYYRRAS